MGAALEVLVGPQAKGLSASTVSRLKQVWAQEYRAWNEERLDKERWVYMWADGVYSGLRAEHTKLCALVDRLNERGEKRFLAIEDGYGNPPERRTETEVARNECALAVGDGAMGFPRWRKFTVRPASKCWMHKTMKY